MTGFSHGDSNPRIRKELANGPQGGQAHNDVAELAEVDNEDIARVERHFKCLSKNSTLA